MINRRKAGDRRKMIEDEPHSAVQQDPTELTRILLQREIASIREILETMIASHDKSDVIRHSEIMERISALRILHDEKFGGALESAKEAVGEQNKASASAIAKSDAATNKQIEAAGQLIISNTAALNSKIDDIKERLTRIESVKQGAQETKTESRASIGVLIAIAVAAATIASGLFGTIASILSSLHPPNTPQQASPQISVPPGYVLVPAAPQAPATGK